MGSYAHRPVARGNNYSILLEKISSGSTSNSDGNSFLKIVYSVEFEYSNNKIESIPIRKEDFIILGFPNLTTGTETLLFQAGNRELLFGTAFDLRLEATTKTDLAKEEVQHRQVSESQGSRIPIIVGHAAFKPVVILSQFISLISKLSFLSLNETALRTKFGIVEGKQDSIPCLANK
ncbi:hypothetical protein R3W88_026634 [Solanum pinnatisectum]|uniref:Uncharacterized protein n=1 Tax=Solanum pinnatisectum TaxID=50273 RepID=A0AAV9LGD4_9SOLN|nr:hypothetical protein R3W88_026634 [Solanum pinnatisectum]